MRAGGGRRLASGHESRRLKGASAAVLRCLPPVRRFGGLFVPSTEAEAVRRGCIERGVCGTPSCQGRRGEYVAGLGIPRAGA